MTEQEKAGQEYVVSFYVTFNVTATSEKDAHEKAIDAMDDALDAGDLGDFVNVDDPFITEA